MSKANALSPEEIWGTDAYERASDIATIVRHSSDVFAEDNYMEPAEAEFEPITFHRLGEFVRGFEVFLEQNNIGFGERCAFISHNSTALAMEFVAIMATGRVFVPPG